METVSLLHALTRTPEPEYYEHFVICDLQAEYQLQERYFNDLVKKEQMEEKMRGVREMKCRAVTCKKVLVQFFPLV